MGTVVIDAEKVRAALKVDRKVFYVTLRSFKGKEEKRFEEIKVAPEYQRVIARFRKEQADLISEHGENQAFKNLKNLYSISQKKVEAILAKTKGGDCPAPLRKRVLQEKAQNLADFLGVELDEILFVKQDTAELNRGKTKHKKQKHLARVKKGDDYGTSLTAAGRTTIDSVLRFKTRHGASNTSEPAFFKFDREALLESLDRAGLTCKTLASACGISESVVESAFRGKAIVLTAARKITRPLGLSFEKAFSKELNAVRLDSAQLENAIRLQFDTYEEAAAFMSLSIRKLTDAVGGQWTTVKSAMCICNALNRNWEDLLIGADYHD